MWDRSLASFDGPARSGESPTHGPSQPMPLTDGPATHRQRRRSWRRALGLCGVLLLLAVGGGLTASMGRAYVVADIKPFDIVAREKYQHTPGPITLVVRGLPAKGGV